MHVYATGAAWLKRHARPAPRREVSLPPAKPPEEKPQPISNTPTPVVPEPALNLQPGEEPLVAEFSAAVGRMPNVTELSFLRNLASAHRSLSHAGHSWMDLSAVANLAPANQRVLVRARTQGNPFENCFSVVPETPLQFWPFIALYFSESGVALPAFTEPFNKIEEARRERDKCRSETLLHHWRQRFAQLDKKASTIPAQLVRQTVRLRLTPKKPVWEVSGGGPFMALSAERLRELLSNPLSAAQLLDDTSNILLAHVRADLQMRGREGLNYSDHQDRVLLGQLLGYERVRSAIVSPDGEPIIDDPRPITWRIDDHPTNPALAIVILALPDGLPLPDPVLYLPGQPAFYLHRFLTLFRGLPPAVEPTKSQHANFAVEIPRAAFELPEAGRFAVRSGVRLPGEFAKRFQSEKLHARVRASLSLRHEGASEEVLVVELHAISPEGALRARYQPEGWRADVPGLDRAKDQAFLLHDFGPLAPASDYLAQLPGLRWVGWTSEGGRYTADVTAKAFPELFADWLAAAPPGLIVELDNELSAFSKPADRVSVAVTVSESSNIDWFDIHTSLRAEDTSLSEKEIDLLMKAKGGWVRLPKRGWRRVTIDSETDAATRAELERLGLAAKADLHTARKTAHRFHVLQLVGSKAAENDEALAARLRVRAAELFAISPPALPEGLNATLRPYQEEGYHFLAHLSSLGLGGILADDMGLGKTLQALAWLLWLQDRAATEKRKFRALVVCPKSVVPNWMIETARFTTALSAGPLDSDAKPDILVINYAQLRLRFLELSSIGWEAVILDEGQNIKNPSSATAQAARDITSRHRLILTGTPIENRLLDLWSLFAFAQPGLLGSQTGFQRFYREKDDPAATHRRLAIRTRPFLLRRTKSQVAKDLPPRVEEEIYCELEGPQRALYDAELKRARQMLVAVKTDRQFNTERFNILQSLLRLRQICCDPRLVGLDTGHPATAIKNTEPEAESEADRPAASAKIEALLDTLEPLVEEGHRVLVFSQFVTMLKLIKAELTERNIDHLLLTGQTENRQELIQRFQSPDGPPVFLLSLKAAGAGLNLTAASYVILYDPWWNPAVEAQAIDRTHRIGQTETVNAYRLLAKNTIEEKIRALQLEKAAMAAAVVKEESLATVLDLESLRRILS